ncbi:MAG: VOC family protein [Proteobacteria bacterium]|nr:VOC family protein [Pseudomonadota bacterium]
MISLSHIGMTVGDLEESIAFYCGVLHCHLQERGSNNTPELAQLTGVPAASIVAADLIAPDGTLIELIQYLNPALSPLRQQPAQTGHTQIAFRVHDLDTLYRRLTIELGRPCTPPAVLSEPGSTWDGARACYAQDPDGRTLELLSHPGAAPDGDI